MKKLIILASLLLFASSVFAGFDSLKIGTGTQTVAIASGDLYVSDAIEVDGTARCDGILSMSAGTAAAPSITFTGDTNLGFYRIGADNLGVSCNGANVLNIATTGMDVVGALTATSFSPGSAILFPVGAAATPSVTFTGDTDTGFYHSAADEISVAIGGVQRAVITATGLNGTAVGATTASTGAFTTVVAGTSIATAVGAVGTPTYFFTGDANTGFYHIAADQIGVAIGGALVLDIPATGIDVTGTGSFTGIVDIPLGAVGAPTLAFTGDPNTGVYSPGADQVSITVGGVAVANVIAAGVDITGTLSTTGIVDIPVGAVGAPSLYFTGDANCGIYHAGADDIGIVAVGADVLRINAGDLDVTGGITATNDFTFGQGPDDLATGYKDRSNYITFVDTFENHTDADYAVNWNVAGVVGLGTNTITVRDGWSELVTGAAGAGDMESTVSNGLNHYRAYTPRIECVVDLTDLVTQTFHFGFYAAANDFVEIIYEAATGANWLLRVDDTAGPETIDSTIVATVNPTKLEIRVAANGAVTWAINDVAMTVVGLTNLMTANAHYVRWAEYTTAAAAHTVAIDYFISEQLKQQ